MRLINTRSFLLEEYFGNQIPKYAILSHTWRDEEVTFQDWQQSFYESVRKRGFKKIEAACSMARSQSIEHLWVDTNCINKDSSSELSEAINSMFTWYRESYICYVYLDDFHYEQNSKLAGLKTSRWFTRGGTLQELLAPENVEFFDASWTKFASKDSLLNEISNITSIEATYLEFPVIIHEASVAQRMSWVATRSTTRVEDMAYCLLGIFEINMPLLYGEGQKAFIRLQEEIIRHSNDQTIFCWSWPASMNSEEIPEWKGCLAPAAYTFRDSGDFVPVITKENNIPTDFLLTNSGLRINLRLIDCLRDDFKLAMLNVSKSSDPTSRLCICLEYARTAGLACSRFPNRLLTFPRHWAQGSQPCYLAHERDPGRRISVFEFGSSNTFSVTQPYAILPIWGQVKNRMFTDFEGHSFSSCNTYSPVIALNTETEDDAWYTRVYSKGQRSYYQIEITVTIEIEQNQESLWNIRKYIGRQDRMGGQVFDAIIGYASVSKRYEFTLNSPSGPTLVRPVLISLSEFGDDET